MTSLLMKPPKHKKPLLPQHEKEFLEKIYSLYSEEELSAWLKDEPPAWHELVLEERAEEWKNREKLAIPLDQAMEELRVELDVEFRKLAKLREC